MPIEQRQPKPGRLNRKVIYVELFGDDGEDFVRRVKALGHTQGGAARLLILDWLKEQRKAESD